MLPSKFQPAVNKSSRKITFFVPGTGIDREVISTDICRYLGNDATVKPGTHSDMETGVNTGGYYVTAYRALTTEQLADLKADSVRWAAERQRNPPRGQNSGGISPRGSDAVMRKSNTIPTEGYRQSITRQQGWSEPPPTGREPGYPPQGYQTAAPPVSRAGYIQPQYTTDRSRDYQGQDNYSLGTTVGYEVQGGQPPRALQPAYQDSRGQIPGNYTQQQRQQPAPVYYNQAGQIVSPPGAQYGQRETPQQELPYGGRDSRDEPMEGIYDDEYQQSPREPEQRPVQRAYREPEPQKDRRHDGRHGRR